MKKTERKARRALIDVETAIRFSHEFLDLPSSSFTATAPLGKTLGDNLKEDARIPGSKNIDTTVMLFFASLLSQDWTEHGKEIEKGDEVNLLIKEILDHSQKGHSLCNKLYPIWEKEGFHGSTISGMDASSYRESLKSIRSHLNRAKDIGLALMFFGGKPSFMRDIDRDDCVRDSGLTPAGFFALVAEELILTAFPSATEDEIENTVKKFVMNRKDFLLSYEADEDTISDRLSVEKSRFRNQLKIAPDKRSESVNHAESSICRFAVNFPRLWRVVDLRENRNFSSAAAIALLLAEGNSTEEYPIVNHLLIEDETMIHSQGYRADVPELRKFFGYSPATESNRGRRPQKSSAKGDHG